MNFDEYKQQYEVITKIIYSYFDRRKYNIVRSYSNSITVTGKRNETSIYIRYEIGSTGLVVNFSNINIDPEYQRQGMFTGLVAAVAKCRYVKVLKIGSVLTEEMRSWCFKNNFITDNMSDYYRVIR